MQLLGFAPFCLFLKCRPMIHACNRAHIGKIYKLQKRAARGVTSSTYDIRSN